MIDQHASLAEKFLKKGFWLYFFSFILAPIGYIIKIIISWELSVSEVWILYGIISLVALLSTYNDLWMTESLNHFIPQYVTKWRYDKVKSILFYALFTQIITSLFIASFFYFWSEYIATHYFKSEAASEVLKVFSLFFIWINIFHTISTFFIAVQDTFYNKLSELCRMGFVLIVVAFMFFWDHGSLINYSHSWIIWLYIWILFILFVFYKNYYKKYFSWVPIVFEKELIVKIAKYAWVVFMTASAGTLLSQMDMQMIIYMLGAQDAWYYTNYLSIVSIPFMIIGPIFILLVPVFSEMYSRWKVDKIKSVKQLFTKHFLIIGIMFNTFLFVFAEAIAYTLFGEKFITSWMILQYSILLLVFNFLLQINFNLLAWIWRVKERAKIIFVAIIFNFIMNIILINTLWVYWAALATGMGWVLIWILSEYTLGKKYHTRFDYILLLKNTIFMWALWVTITIFIAPLLSWLSRIHSFWSLASLAIIWFTIFCWLNFKDFKFFIWEIKKLKQ